MSQDDILEAIGILIIVACAGAITAGIVVAAYVEGGYVAAVFGGIVATIGILVFAEWSHG